MKRAPSLEPLLPLDYRQPPRGRVSERIYEAVVTLRRGGHTVWSIGPDAHKVDGKVASTKQLLLMARLEAEVAS